MVHDEPWGHRVAAARLAWGLAVLAGALALTAPAQAARGFGTKRGQAAAKVAANRLCRDGEKTKRARSDDERPEATVRRRGFGRRPDAGSDRTSPRKEGRDPTLGRKSGEAVTGDPNRGRARSRRDRDDDRYRSVAQSGDEWGERYPAGNVRLDIEPRNVWVTVSGVLSANRGQGWLSLPAGVYVLVATRRGYRPWLAPLVVEPGRSYSVTARLERLRMEAAGGQNTGWPSALPWLQGTCLDASGRGPQHAATPSAASPPGRRKTGVAL
jgi:hypothetical protein